MSIKDLTGVRVDAPAVNDVQTWTIRRRGRSRRTIAAEAAGSARRWARQSPDVGEVRRRPADARLVGDVPGVPAETGPRLVTTVLAVFT